MKKKSETDLEPVLQEIDIALRRQNSFLYIFLHGVVRGMGTALGATVLVAIVTSITIHFAGSAHADAVLKSIIDSMFE